MAVVNLKSSVFRADDNKPLDPMHKAARLIIITATVMNAATDSSGSTYHLADLPSDCLLHDLTGFDVEAWGFAQVNIGTLTDNDALSTVARSAGVTHRPVVFGDAKHGKHLWEILGLASDPGGVIGLYLHASAAATAAGSCPFQIVYMAR